MRRRTSGSVNVSIETTFSLELCPLTISSRDLLTPKVLASSAIAPTLALPSVGGAVTRNPNVSPSNPSTWFREDLGWTLIFSLLLSSGCFDCLGLKFMA
jgi:hypothetical protein